MKKLLSLLLALALVFSLAACGSKAESPADSSADQNTAAPTETDAKTYKVAIIKQGRLIASGTMDEVKGDDSLEEVFLELEGETC